MRRGGSDEGWSDDALTQVRLALRLTRHSAVGVPIWVAAPTMVLLAMPGIAVQGRPAGLPDRARDWLRTVGAAGTRSRGPELRYQDGVLFVSEPHSPARIITRIIEARAANGCSGATPLSQPSDFGAVVGWSLQADRGARLIEECLRSYGRPAPARFLSVLFSAARGLARAERVLDEVRPALVVMASQHSPSSRAFTYVARETGVPTLYIPHAPVAANVQYSDLPTDFAALRGRGEVDYYVNLGAARSRLFIAGNPDASINAPQRLATDFPPVFAPSPWLPARVKAQVQMLRDAFNGKVLVAPHPRMRGKSEYEDLWPAEWDVYSGRTLDLISAGCPVLIQSSSGVTWESLVHGIPTIEIVVEGEDPNYPIIRRPHVLFARDARELGAALRVALARGVSTVEREALVGWAKYWCECAGRDAAMEVCRLIDEAICSGLQNDPILDGWSRSE